MYVGAAGFEPAAPCSQSRCANRTALRPEYFIRFVETARTEFIKLSPNRMRDYCK